MSDTFNPGFLVEADWLDTLNAPCEGKSELLDSACSANKHVKKDTITISDARASNVRPCDDCAVIP